MTDLPLARKRPFLISALLMFLITVISGGAGVYVLTDPGLHQSLDLFRTANVINSLYEHEVDWDQLMENGMRGMFDQLDPYSGYVAPRRWDRMYEELSGSYTGIGVTVIQHDSGLMIVSVREDGPAAAAGMISGDIVMRLDSVNLAGLNIYETTDILRGPEDTEVDLGLYRPFDDDTLTVTVTRKKIDFVHIPFAGYTPDSVIYIRLLDFDAGASDDVRDALDSLLNREGAQPVGLILDLRGNPGGLFSEAYETANLFLESGQFIVGTAGRSRWNNERHESSGEDMTGGLPMAILVDGGSASSSEIVAGSLSQLGRATLVGDTTFGKGLVQGYKRLYDGSGVRLTISRYYLEGGLFLTTYDSLTEKIGHGLIPDYLVELPGQQSFVRALERSLFLDRFVARHREELAAAADQFGLDDSWVAKFEQYARAEQFDYKSSTTDVIEEMLLLIAIDGAGPQVKRTVGDVYDRSLELDRHVFVDHADYIKRRLAQIALEQTSGSYTAYQKAIVPSRPDIRIATELLKASHQ